MSTFDGIVINFIECQTDDMGKTKVFEVKLTKKVVYGFIYLLKQSVLTKKVD